MESGFGQNLEGFLIKGNLSLAPAANPYLQGDGSVEGSGTLYFDSIKEYNYANGVNIQNVNFKNDQLLIPYTLPSVNATTASVIIDGGLAIKHPQNAASITSGGALTVVGGVSIGKRLIIGGEVDVSGNYIKNVAYPINGTDGVNKDYVDNVASKLSGNFTTGQIIIADSNGDAIRGYDFFTTDTTKLNLSIPFYISDTTNTNGLGSGGSLNILGGVNISKDTYIGGVLDLSGNVISNVGSPVNSSDVATKQYVDDRKINGNFTTGQLLIADSVGDAIRGYDNLTYDGITITLASTNNITTSIGGSFVCYGGISISKDVFIGGTLNVNNNKITNVGYPVDQTDAANKQYVDDHKLQGNFTTGQVIIAASNGDEIRGYSSFTYDGSNLILGTASSFIVSNTQNALSLSSGGVFVVEGGAIVKQDVFIGGGLDVSDNTITSVGYPVNQTDAANKQYVDDNKLQGNFTTGQIIIAETNGDAIQGFNNLVFTGDGTNGSLILNPYTSIYLTSTSDSAGLGSGGSFTSYGGASFEKSVYIGGQLDLNVKRITNVSSPLEDLDAVNKVYVDALFSSLSDSCCSGGIISDNAYENTFILNNNVTLAEDISKFNFDNSVKAFISYVYIQVNNEKNAFYTIRGINSGANWEITSTYIGQSTGVDFYINTDGGQGIMQYTNSNYTGVVTIKFRTITQINDVAGTTQNNSTLLNNVSSFQDITGLSYINSELNSVKVIAYVSNDTNDKYSLYFLSCLLKGNEWVMQSYYIGDNTGIAFAINTIDSIGKIKYTNTNNDGVYTIRFQQFKIFKSLSSIILTANTLIPNVISNKLVFSNSSNTFQLTIYVEIVELSKYAMYEIEGYLQNDIWKINSRYIGDRTGIVFNISTLEGDGYLRYTNPNGYDAKIRYLKNTPLIFEPLQVSKGGTGNTQLRPYAVLRGNGTDPIVGTDDFIYKDYQLILSKESSIILNNTTGATNLTTGGTFTTYGGVSIGKNLLIGGGLDVNNNTITSVSYPVNQTDAANKQYVDDHKLQGNFTTGQIIIAQTNGDAIRGFDNLVFTGDGTSGSLILNPYTSIYLTSTSDSVGLGTGGSFTSYGGASFEKSVYIGGQLDLNIQRITNVSTPLEDLDAVNKAYVDELVSRKICPISDKINVNVNAFILNNNVTLAEDISKFNFDNSVKAFISYAYIQINNEKNAFYTIRGINSGSNWEITSTYVGQNTGLEFYIRTDEGQGIMQYTNSNYAGVTSIKFRTITQINDVAGDAQNNSTLLNSVSSFQDISGLSYINSEFNSVKVIAYVSNDTNDKYSLYFLSCLLKGNEWVMQSYYIGDNTGIAFAINTIDSIGKIKYTNTNDDGVYTIRFQQFEILKSLSSITLTANTLISNVISDKLVFSNSSDTFQLTIYVEIVELSKYAMYEIEGYLQNDIWKINSRYIGDRTGIVFDISTLKGNGYLRYTNPNVYDAKIRYLKDTPLICEPLQVSKGGTGNTQLTPYAVLRGNGTDPIAGSNDFIYKDNQLILAKESSIILKSTTGATNLTTGGTFTTYGGVSVGKNLLIGGGLDVNNNAITSVGYPVNQTDAASKQYVDDQTIQGNFTTGQVIIAHTNGDAIRGFDNLIFTGDGTSGSLILNPYTSIYLTSTSDSAGLGTGGSFTSYGGASFEKSVYIGGQLDLNVQRITNVSSPLEDFDAVNKAYVDALFSSVGESCCSDPISDNTYENTFVLNNNVTLVQDISKFNFDNSVKAFISYVYIQVSNEKNAFYTIRGFNNGAEWKITSTYIGQSTGVDFYIRTDGGQGIMQYTNSNYTGVASIKFRTITQINDVAGATQINSTLLNSVSSFQDISGLSYINSELNSVKVIVYVSNDTNDKYSLYFLSCLLKGDEWVMQSYYIGDNTGITFAINTINSIGKIKYTNTNDDGVYTIRFQQFKIFKNVSSIILTANTLIPNVISDKLIFSNSSNTFQLTIYVEIVELSKYAMYEIEGYLQNDIWKINSRYIGDRTGIVFDISTLTGDGYLRYTNPNVYDAKIRYLKNTPLIFEPLQVSKGGTGNTQLTPYAVLRGNGTDPIVGTDDFIYKDYQLLLAKESSIILNNTTGATNLTTGGTFTTYGGVSVGKNLLVGSGITIYNTHAAINLTTGGTITTYGGVSVGKNLLVGESLIVKNIDVTPSPGDIWAERSYNASNNQTFPDSIDNFEFTNANIKSFSGIACITIVADAVEYDTLYEIKGIRKSSGWIMNSTYIGDNTNIKFTITPYGQMQYTSPNITDWISTTIKFRAMTTTY